MDNQAKLEKLKQKLLSYTREDYEMGLPYNDAKAYASSYDEYLEAIEVVENAARELGVSEDILSTLRAAYETTYYPYQYSYGFRNEKKYFLIPKFNASPEYEKDKYKLEIEGHPYLLDLGDYHVDNNGVF